MSLKISLIDHIKAIFVTKVKEVWIVRIMGGSDRIEIELLDQTEIGLDLLSCYRLASELTMIMTIHAIELHRNTIYKYLLTSESDITEADLTAARLHTFTLCIRKFQHQGI